MERTHRPPRLLFISGSIGLGHATRDLAIAAELRRARPDLEIDWPETAATGFGLNIPRYLMRTRKAWKQAVRTFEQVTSGGRYDVIVGDARMVLVCGPRLDPTTITAPASVEVRGYVPRLYEHFAASDLAIVQAGGTTTLELTALRRPFLYVLLEGHFEQEIAVAGRLARHGAGERLPHAALTPDALAESAVRLLRSEPDWPVIPVDGARRAAAPIATQLPTPTPAAR